MTRYQQTADARYEAAEKRHEETMIAKSKLDDERKQFEQYRQELLDIEDIRHNEIMAERLRLHRLRVEVEAESQCQICMANAKNVTFVPCGHRVSCFLHIIFYYIIMILYLRAARRARTA